MQIREASAASIAKLKIPKPTWKIVVERVAREFELTPADILGDSRKANILEARHVAIWLCRLETKLSFPQIGAVFNKDHTTIIHAYRKMEKRDESFKRGFLRYRWVCHPYGARCIDLRDRDALT